MTAHDLMTPNPSTVTPQTSIAEVWDLMRVLDVRHMPVVENEVLVGMLSDRDLGSLEVARLLAEEGAEALRRRLARPVVQFMSADVVAAELETDVSELVIGGYSRRLRPAERRGRVGDARAHPGPFDVGRLSRCAGTTG